MRTREIRKFQDVVYAYHKEHGRIFPWRKTKNPYRIFVSEIMLQQTQVDRVVSKYKEFLKQFPTVEVLAKSSLAEVLRVWQGLGYNRRARMLHEASKVLRDQYRGAIPKGRKELEGLPGVGVYTAGAVRVFAFNLPSVLIETNIRTVYLYHFFKNKDEVADTMLRPYIEETMDRDNPRLWYSALMDYGTYLKKSEGNVSVRSKHHTKQSCFAGSDRQIRGDIITILSNRKDSVSLSGFKKNMPHEGKRIEKQLAVLLKEGMISTKRRGYTLG